uniref:Uncharacterized protein n=1 Tax=Caenorhabditis japonica TaxID=281687 RepID=A0A8R1EAZ2_CAEJA
MLASTPVQMRPKHAQRLMKHCDTCVKRTFPRDVENASAASNYHMYCHVATSFLVYKQPLGILIDSSM